MLMYEFDYVDEIIVIRFLPIPKGLYVYWMPNNDCMSRLEFSRAIEIFMNTVTVTQPTKVLINASDYNYPILPEKTIRLIRYALSVSSLKQYGLVTSHHFYGQIAINLLLKQLTSTQIELTLFDKHVEGIRWVLRN
jgi:hypothetical protein